MFKVNKAFSLIELSMVILILGILIAGVTAGNRLLNKSKRTTASNYTKTSIVASIPDLVFWADASSDEAFDDSVTVNSIATWYDITPYAASKNNATQATAANRPTFVDGAINNLPALRFDGTNDSLSIDGSFMANRNYSIFVVEQRRGSTSGSYFYSPSSLGLYVGYATSTEFRISSSYGASDWTSLTISAYNSPSAKIISLIGQPASNPAKIRNTLYFNGSQQKDDTIGRNNYGNSSTYKIGSNPYQGDIGELIIFKRKVKPSERGDIQEYLSKKWGIALQ